MGQRGGDKLATRKNRQEHNSTIKYLDERVSMRIIYYIVTDTQLTKIRYLTQQRNVKMKVDSSIKYRHTYLVQLTHFVNPTMTEEV